jgi:hypothetical protein
LLKITPTAIAAMTSPKAVKAMISVLIVILVSQNSSKRIISSSMPRSSSIPSADPSISGGPHR